MARAAQVMEKLKPYFETEEAVAASYLFGSTVSGHQRPGSDIDIAVLLDDRDGKQERLAVWERLVVGLSRRLHGDVHLLVLNDASYLARMEVFSKGKLIYVRDELFLAEFRMVSTALYADFAPYRRELENRLKRRFCGKS